MTGRDDSEVSGPAPPPSGPSDPRARELWRSLEELAGAAASLEPLGDALARASLSDAIDRRQLLRLMASSIALAGLNACTRQPVERIVPYVRPPEEILPGKPLYYATAATLGGFARGVLVCSHMGRPTKVEGNPEHPASLGAADAFAQASVLGLYDPDRSQAVTHNGRISSWVSFLGALLREREAQLLKKGEGLCILSGTTTSPTLATQLEEVMALFPAARWFEHEPVSSGARRAASKAAFGAELGAFYRIERASVIVALDADFLGSGPAALRYAREWAARRQGRGSSTAMNRLYAIESVMSPTGAMADHRLRLRAREVAAFARALARRLGIDAVAPPDAAVDTRWVETTASDLMRHRGSSAVIAGAHQTAEVHALAHAVNHALGNSGAAVVYTDPVETIVPGRGLPELVEAIRSGSVEVLWILGSNPVYTAPADLDFAGALGRVRWSAHLAPYADETSALCRWHVPEAHYLESWSDARAYDGTASIVQPLIAPLYQGRTAHELLAVLAGRSQTTPHAIVREYWQKRLAGPDFDAVWEKALHDGVVPGTALPPKAVGAPNRAAWQPAGPEAPAGLEIVFRPDPSVWDGCFANNAWLQELPKPLTTLTWDNAALVSPATAARHGFASGDVVELRYRGRSLRAPIWVAPGHPDDSVALHLGYGRTRAGRIGNGAGANAYLLRGTEAAWFGQGLELAKTGSRQRLAATQQHHSLEGRAIVRWASADEYARNPEVVHEKGHEPAADLSLYSAYPSPGYAWGMAINLSSCIGCNACVVACQAENNVPVVGRDQVERGREMHWLRIDRYFEGSPEAPRAYFQPMLCQHCETAPCEIVCPVNATVHSEEGLNQMVYNRCVGTRYCSNNCPYKVRRFNFLQYADLETPSLEGLRNPDVTVRSRGVMEKCTYCVQRIQSAKIASEKEDRRVRDGDIVTACQAACPTEAIVFGDIHDTSSRVSRLKAEPRNYGVLAELNTRPRTTYLARLTNPDPELEKT